MDYEEHELLWLFEKEPIITLDDDGYDFGDRSYSTSDKKSIKLILSLNMYEETCSIFIKFKNKYIFYCDLEHVKKLERKENNLIVYVEKQSRVKINFDNEPSVEILGGL